jgi:Chromosome segregation ATPases
MQLTLEQAKKERERKRIMIHQHHHHLILGKVYRLCLIIFFFLVGKEELPFCWSKSSLLVLGFSPTQIWAVRRSRPYSNPRQSLYLGSSLFSSSSLGSDDPADTDHDRKDDKDSAEDKGTPSSPSSSSPSSSSFASSGSVVKGSNVATRVASRETSKVEKKQQAQINRLKFRLNELQQSLEESERQKEQLELELKSYQNKKEDLSRLQKEQQQQQQIQQIQQQLEQNQQEQLKRIGAQEEHLQSLMEEREQLVQKIDELTRQLEQVSKVVVDKDNELMELQKQYTEELERQSLESKAMQKESLQRMNEVQEELNVQKDLFMEQQQAHEKELQDLKQQSSDELDKVRKQSENDTYKLKSVLVAKREELERMLQEVKLAEDQVQLTRKEAQENVERQQEESRKFQRTINEISIREKKGLQKQIWELETRVQAAEYNLIMAQKKAKELGNVVTSLERRIHELELDHSMELEELNERLKAEEWFYAKSKLSAKIRMQRLVEMFQRRMRRRENRARDNIEDLRVKLMEQFDLEKTELAREKDDAVEEMKNKGERDLEMAKEQFNAETSKIKNEIIIAQDKAREEINELKIGFETDLKSESLKMQQEKEAILAKKELEISQVQEEARRMYDTLKMNMNQKLEKSSKEKLALRQIIDEKDEQIRSFEADQSSFRKLVKLTWKVTREKITRRRNRQ